MTHLIDKSALVTEIKRRIDCCYKMCAGDWSFLQKAYPEHYYSIETYKEILSFVDTLEVKEVDLNEEAELIANGIMIDVQANKYNTVVYNTKRNDFNHSHLMLAARKGIELGLKASNPITAADRGTAEEIIISLKQVENDYHIDQTKEIEWVRNKVKKERDTIETKEIDLDKTIDK